MLPVSGNPSKKRQRKRKARTTEVSSSSDSSSSSDESVNEKAKKEKKKKSKSSKTNSVQPKTSENEAKPQIEDGAQHNGAAPEQVSTVSPEPATDIIPVVEDTSNRAFTQAYLRMMTTQFSDDLDALRRAADFKESSSVGILVNALKQGESLFSDAEKEIILGGGRVTGVQ